MGVNEGPHKYRNTNVSVSLFPGYFISIFGKASTVHAQCCVVVVVVIVVLTDITIDVYNYRPLKRFLKNLNKIKTTTRKINPKFSFQSVLWIKPSLFLRWWCPRVTNPPIPP